MRRNRRLDSRGKGKKRGTSAECVLLHQRSKRIRALGGEKVIGYPSNHRVKFCYSSIPNRVPFIGLRIYFPRASDTAIDFYNDEGGHYNPDPNLVIGFFLPLETGTRTSGMASEELLSVLPPRKDPLKQQPLEVIRVSVKDGAKPVIWCLGMPLVARDAENDRAIHHGAKLEGLVTLRELFGQTEIRVCSQASYSTRRP